MNQINLLLQVVGKKGVEHLEAGNGLGFFGTVFYLAFAIFMVVSMWKMYEKAGQPGWAALVPIYNVYVLFRIAGEKGIMMLLLFIPFLNIYIMIKVYIGIAKAFGKDGIFAVGLIFLSFIFVPILAFGDAKYVGV